MRLDKFLAHTGFGTRTEVKALVKGRRVKVNEKVVINNDYKLNMKSDNVYVDDELIVYKEYIYIMLNKPQGYISAVEDDFHQTVVDLMPEYSHYDIHHVGRLDIDTEGLLILTNDGKLTHELISPRHHVPKVYYAKLRDKISANAIPLFKEGITLDDGYECMSATLNILNDNEVELTIYEGKFHQVKRMFEAIDNKVVFLKRLQIGNLKLDKTLEPGEYRELTQDEISNITNKVL